MQCLVCKWAQIAVLGSYFYCQDYYPSEGIELLLQLFYCAFCRKGPWLSRAILCKARQLCCHWITVWLFCFFVSVILHDSNRSSACVTLDLQERGDKWLQFLLSCTERATLGSGSSSLLWQRANGKLFFLSPWGSAPPILFNGSLFTVKEILEICVNLNYVTVDSEELMFRS